MNKASSWLRRAGRLVGAAVLAMTLAPWLVASAAAQETSTVIQLESPTTEPVGTRLMVSGWAADPAGEGTGVDIVQLYLGDPQAGGQLLGTATYGQARPAAAEALGEERFANSGFEMALELPPGEYTLYVYAHRNTAAPDDGWAVLSQTFTASSSVPPDPRAVAILGGELQVRAAAPPPAATTPSGASNPSTTTPAARGSIVSGGGVRTTVNPHDPMPVDPLGSAGGSMFVSPGRDGPDLVDSMGMVPGAGAASGSPSGIRQSVISDTAAGTYRTGQVNLVGGSGTQCPGPNCPAAQSNVANTLNSLPPELVREITGYNIPGVGSTQVCTPANVPGGVQGACNPVTGTASAPGAPTNADLMRQRAQQALNSVGQNAIAQTPNTATPACLQYGPNGQCVQPMNQVGFNGSVCVAWAGTNCVRWEAPQQLGAQAGGLGTGAQPGTAQLTPQQLAALQAALGQTGTNALGTGAATTGSGYLNTSSQYLNTSSSYLNSSGYLNTAATPSGYTSPGAVTAPPSTAVTNPYAANPYAAVPTTASYPTSSSGGICLQYNANGQCVATR